jgi:hypothetical protein
MANHADVKEFFSGGDEPFRVVPVDRAGSLVRDHVIFSLGYGRTPHGRAMHHFGPLSEPGGRRRFALAMSRARHTLHVLSCFQPGELDSSRLTEGAKDFHELLERELAGRTDLGTRATRAAASAEALGADPLVTDLGERLASRGARVWHHYDGAIDMAAAVDPLLTLSRDDPEAHVPVAVESDGTKRYRGLSVRERTRQRPELLERMGWRYFTLWTIEVFTDPGSCADMIADLLGLDGQSDDGSGAGFLAGPLGTAASSFDAVVSASYPLAGGQPPAQRAGAQRATREYADSWDDGEIEHDRDSEDDPYEEGAPVAARDHVSSHRRVSAPATGTAGQVGTAGQSGEESQPRYDEGSTETRPDRRAQSEGEAHGAAASETPLIPQRAAEDDPRSWGDQESDQDRDQWLKEQRPPHWG